jgi:hypothetical protein
LTDFDPRPIYFSQRHGEHGGLFGQEGLAGSKTSSAISAPLRETSSANCFVFSAVFAVSP